MAAPKPPEPIATRPLHHRLAWMAAIWAASVAALGVVALILRWWLGLG